MTGNGNDDANSLVERREDGGLPPPSRKAGNGNTTGVGVAVGEEDVESALDQQVEDADAGNAADVEQGDAAVIGVAPQLAHADELRVESQHAAFGQVDAAGLFVVHGLAPDVMSVGVQDGRHLAGQVGRFVQQRRHPHTGIALVAQFAYPVPLAGFDRLRPLDAGALLKQFLRMPAQVGTPDLPAYPRRGLYPGGDGRRRIQRR